MLPFKLEIRKLYFMCRGKFTGFFNIGETVQLRKYLWLSTPEVVESDNQVFHTDAMVLLEKRSHNLMAVTLTKFFHLTFLISSYILFQWASCLLQYPTYA